MATTPIFNTHFGAITLHLDTRVVVTNAEGLDASVVVQSQPTVVPPGASVIDQTFATAWRAQHPNPGGFLSGIVLGL